MLLLRPRLDGVSSLSGDNVAVADERRAGPGAGGGVGVDAAVDVDQAGLDLGQGRVALVSRIGALGRRVVVVVAGLIVTLVVRRRLSLLGPDFKEPLREESRLGVLLLALAGGGHVVRNFDWRRKWRRSHCWLLCRCRGQGSLDYYAGGAVAVAGFVIATVVDLEPLLFLSHEVSREKLLLVATPLDFVAGPGQEKLLSLL